MNNSIELSCDTCKYEKLEGYEYPCDDCDEEYSNWVQVFPNEVATRYNEGKPRLGLVPPEIIVGIGEVLTFGAQKYEDNNWKKGLSDENCMSSCLRHIMKFQKGELYDEESGLHHLKHAACNIAFMLYFHENK